MPDFSDLALPLAKAFGAQVSLGESRAVGGGSIHAAWRVETNRGAIFVKSNDAAALPMFEAEAAGLSRIAATSTVRTPRVLGVGAMEALAWLALEWLELQPLDAEGGKQLGRQLADLHRSTGDVYGLDNDSYIGSTPQINTPHPSWPYFFAQRRLAPLIELAAQRGLERELCVRGERLVEKLGGFFDGVPLKPSLLHGDLWSGNAAQLADGTPVIYDPALYYGHREADLAMAELFGGFPSSFYASYRLAWRFADGFEQRKTLYNLYHMLNHFILFGDTYRHQVKRMIDTLVSELG